jgi:hypothetical protein
MAILESLPGLEVTVCMDGQPLEEYDDNEEEEVGETPVAQYQAAKTVSKYIESASEKEFSINITLGTAFTMDFESLMAPIRMDGKFVAGPVMLKKRYLGSMRGSRILTPLSRTVHGVHSPAPGNDERILLRKFKFGKIDTSKLLLLITAVLAG